MSPAPALVGLDGGATSAKACRVRVGAGGLVTAAGAHEQPYRPVNGFRAVAQDERERAPLTEAERDLACSWIEAAARAVAAVAPSGTETLVGACMPGLKTADRRGIAWARHGPRIPDLADRLEQALRERGVLLLAPIAALHSDGDCCGWGEQRAEGGLFAEVTSAWYAGGGTGLAEALKLGGELVDMDALGGRVPQAWRLAWRDAQSFEDALSLRGLNARAGGRIEELAASARGRALLVEAGAALAELAALRARQVEALGRGPLERAVVGQRLGLLLAAGRLQPMRSALAGELARRGLPREGWLVCSRLREAPALGAAARALAAWEGGRG